MGGEPLLAKERVFDYIKEGFEDEVRKRINAAENFFKHADRDHDETFDFNPGQSDFLLLEACSVYYKLTGEDPILFKIFRPWYMVHNPTLFKQPAVRDLLLGNLEDIKNLGRAAYFNLILPQVMSLPGKS